MQQQQNAEDSRIEKEARDKEAKEKADKDPYLSQVDEHLKELVKEVLKPAKKSETKYVKVKNIKN